MHTLLYTLPIAAILAMPHAQRRGLADLFDDDADVQQAAIDETATPVDEHTPTSSKIKAVTRTTDHETTGPAYMHTSTSTIPLSSSLIHDTEFRIASSTSTLASTIPYARPPAVSIGSLPEGPPTSPEEATQWKIIGIGIITVGLIATLILAVAFFDSWWKFLRDSLCGCCRRDKSGEEKMVPDWDKRDWEFQLANEDGHRYPTLVSLNNIAKDQEQNRSKNMNLTPLTTIPPPERVFSPDYDAHPLEPLTRRPSMRQAL